MSKVLQARFMLAVLNILVLMIRRDEDPNKIARVVLQAGGIIQALEFFIREHEHE